ncbi:hypothetical protein EJP02_434 [Escherichia phage EJP2]|nr:hypothetical protein EJP02_434 [Escherichia phage EJP2]
MKTKNSKSLGTYVNGNRYAKISTCIDCSTGNTLYYYCIPGERVYISSEEFKNEWVKN